MPVTLKIRTGFARTQRNGVAIARIAEDVGIQALAVHGRTREDQYAGAAEYETIAAIKNAVKIPVIANGDVDTPHKARSEEHTSELQSLMRSSCAVCCLNNKKMHKMEQNKTQN